MGRILAIVILLLGRACPGHLPSSHLTLTSTQNSFESILISCMVRAPEERVTQVHWKERHADGRYTMIAVQNPHWGNATQTPYKMVVKLNKVDDTTYTLEMMDNGKVVCCEVVTYPSGMIQESCLTIEGDAVPGDGGVHAAVLGISGFFIFGSIILLCHIVWMKRNTRRALDLRAASGHVWTRGRRSSVPYSRTPPSVNLAYEPPLDSAHLQENQPEYETRSPRPPQYLEAPPLRNQWPSEASAGADPPPYSNPFSAPLDPSSSVNHLYSNILRHKRPHLKLPNLPTPQNQSPEPGGLLHTSPSRPVSILPHHITNAAWLCGETSYLPEENFTMQPPRPCVPRAPESPFSTINPMYHSLAEWGPQPPRPAHQRATLS